MMVATTFSQSQCKLDQCYQLRAAGNKLAGQSCKLYCSRLTETIIRDASLLKQIIAGLGGAGCVLNYGCCAGTMALKEENYKRS